MTKNQKIVLVVIAVAVFGTLIFLGTGQRSGVPGGPTAEEGTPVVLGEDVFRPENPDALETIEGGTREKIKTKIATPDAEADAPENVAVPASVGRIGNINKRVFNLEGAQGELSADTIVVDVLDIVQINLTATDRDYSISFPDFGAGKSASAGETARFQFQAQFFGEYKFFCGGCKSGWEGTLIVNKKGSE